ncbi:aminoglycoside phosphotransferase family protein [Paenibacillus sp. Z6-24]
MDIQSIDDRNVQQLTAILHSIVEFDDAILLSGGYSDTIKYICYQSDRPLYLLRVYPLYRYEHCTQEQRYLQQHYDNGVSCQQPIYSGIFPELNCCCLLLPYMAGEDGEAALPQLAPDEQYIQGLAAGRQLHSIHRITPDSSFNWADQRYKKYISKKTAVQKLGVSFEQQKELERYIERHTYMLEHRPVVFQHDDFHPANMIFKEGRLHGIIDFSRFDWAIHGRSFSSCPSIRVRQVYRLHGDRWMGILISRSRMISGPDIICS